MILEISPPDAIFASGFKDIPGFVEIINSTSSNPFGDSLYSPSGNFFSTKVASN